MGHQGALPREEMIDFVMSCWDEEAGEHESALHSECEANGEMSWMKVHLDPIRTTMHIFWRR